MNPSRIFLEGKLTTVTKGHHKYTLLFKVPLSPSSLVPSTSPDPHPLSSFHNYILYLFPLGFLALLAFWPSWPFLLERLQCLICAVPLSLLSVCLQARSRVQMSGHYCCAFILHILLLGKQFATNFALITYF